MIKFNQPSTKKGLAGLISSAAVLASGAPSELITVAANGDGMAIGGLLGLAATLGLQFWESLRDEDKAK